MNMNRLEQIKTRWEQDKLLYSDVEWLIVALEFTIVQCNEVIEDRDKEIEYLYNQLRK